MATVTLCPSWYFEFFERNAHCFFDASWKLIWDDCSTAPRPRSTKTLPPPPIELWTPKTRTGEPPGKRGRGDGEPRWPARRRYTWDVLILDVRLEGKGVGGWVLWQTTNLPTSIFFHTTCPNVSNFLDNNYFWKFLQTSIETTLTSGNYLGFPPQFR